MTIIRIMKFFSHEDNMIVLLNYFVSFW